MRTVLVGLLVAAPAVVVFLVMAARDDQPTARAETRTVPGEDAVARAQVERLNERLRDAETTIAELQQRVAVLQRGLGDSRPGGDGPDALDQYVLSFAEGTEGSEFFRLAVEAHAPAYLDRLLGILADRARPDGLRAKIAGVLGLPAFRRNGAAIGGLLAVVVRDEPRTVVLAALKSLGAIGTPGIAADLAARMRDLEDRGLRTTVLRMAVTLAEGEESTRMVTRALSDAKDDAERRRFLDVVPAPLPVLREASRYGPSVRFAAARKLTRLRGEGVREFIDERLAVETDKEVRAVLEKAKKDLDKIPNWHALQAIGKPDAIPPNSDNPKAWAPRTGEMGMQWIELTYAEPRRAHTVRIYEVNVAGAVARVETVDTAGRRRVVWRGTDPTTAPGVFEVRFEPTSYSVRRVRIVLDTDRHKGWDEIDAVELVGPDGRAWASGAVASSTYGQ